MDDDRQKLVVIAGPTASGKSSLAVELAARIGGEIVNADSMQVYRHMDIGTATPSEEERGGIPHHLLDVADPDEAFNASSYRALALPVLEGMESRRRPALVVGGTGLYIKTLLGGLFDCPSTDPELRGALNREWEEQGGGALHERLMALDREAGSRIHPHDRVRIIRALEVVLLTGRPFSAMAREHGFGDRPFRALKICLQMDRDGLYHRIDQRCLDMVEKGLVRETEALLEMGYSPDLKPMKALGYRHMIKVLEGTWDLDKAIEQLQRDTRRYAKRQLTWFRGDPEVIWADPGDRDGVLALIGAFLGSTNNRGPER